MNDPVTGKIIVVAYEVHDASEAQFVNYLNAIKKDAGLLVNFRSGGSHCQAQIPRLSSGE